jgi:hypothetical protein
MPAVRISILTAAVAWCGAALAEPAIPIETEALSDTSWVLVAPSGEPTVKDMKLERGGTVGGGAKGGMLERWEVVDGALVIWAQGGSKAALFEEALVSPRGRPTLKGHSPDFPESKTRAILALTSEQLAAAMTSEALTATSWQMRNDDGSVAKETLTLAAGGKVEGIAADDYWIDAWSIEDGELVFRKKGSANFRFAFPTEDDAGRRVLNGYLSINPYQELTLVEMEPKP